MSECDIKGRYYKVLDHGFVSLVDYMGSDDDIANAARVSYTSATKRTDNEKLIRYMYKHGHTSPFEMVEFKFHCKMPIFVARQWIRHRTANVNEQSGRYSVLDQEFYTPEKEHYCPQSMTNKQGRSDESVSDEAYNMFIETSCASRAGVSEAYNRLLDAGVSRELARIDLPLSLYTQWYWKIDLHNLLHFLKLRCDPHAQYEIVQYANVMAGMIERMVPIAFQAWIDYGFRSAK